MGALCLLTSFTFLSETYEPVLLRRKAARLRRETHNPHLYSTFDTNHSIPKSQILLSAMLRPLKMLFLLPNVFFLSLITAVGYGYMYILYTTITTTFTYDYGWTRKNVGLAYLGSAVGNLLAMVIGGKGSDFIVKKCQAKGDTRPENRLLLMIFFWPLVAVGFILYGWSAEMVWPWWWPMIGSAIFGMGSMSAIVSPPIPFPESFPHSS